jgi:hypothetical protein
MTSVRVRASGYFKKVVSFFSSQTIFQMWRSHLFLSLVFDVANTDPVEAVLEGGNTLSKYCQNGPPAMNWGNICIGLHSYLLQPFH